ncbi:proton channel OtopLc-like [Prorops nasuta]|uniref:proton channel OtopLc-like n=1 Tax=Prorops nasuta TaxID=863751 RepID=UPI0034CD60E6
MVAELAGICATSVERRGRGLKKVRSFGKQRKRPRWIQNSTREPIYSVLDGTENFYRQFPPGIRDKVVIIRAVKCGPRKENRGSSLSHSKEALKSKKKSGLFRSNLENRKRNSEATGTLRKLNEKDERDLRFKNNRGSSLIYRKEAVKPQKNSRDFRSSLENQKDTTEVTCTLKLDEEDESDLSFNNKRESLLNRSTELLKLRKKTGDLRKSLENQKHTTEVSCTLKLDEEEDKDLKFNGNRETGSDSSSPRLLVEDENALYSVVIKPKKKVEKTLEKLDCAVEKGKPELSRQEELKRWLKIASDQIPKPSELFDLSEMYRDFGEPNNDWRKPLAIPRGVVGLVGPYRIYPDPNERREYMLQEEELVEEIVDSVSEVAARENDNCQVVENSGAGEQKHQRAKWKIRDDDEETLVPDIRKLPNPVEYAVDGDAKEEKSISDWSKADEPVTNCDLNRDENWKTKEIVRKEIHLGQQERAVDVPDGASAISASTAKIRQASNEQHDKDSLNETGSTTGGNVEGAPGGSPSRGERNNEQRDELPGVQGASTSAPPRSLISRILARARSPEDLLDHSEPFSQLWVVLSNVYGELMVVLMMAFCLAEVMDTPVPLLTLQGVFLMYLYVGSIGVIICIYIWVLVDSCSSMSRVGGLEDAELGGASLTRFGSLKRAHISRARTAPTSFYIRVGALLFGLATLVFNGLEMAMHSMMQGAECLSDVIFVHPVLHGLFTFLQMHFLFVNSQVLVERFGLAARFGFTHLAATNIAVWVRLVIWDSAQEWTYFVYLAQRGLHASASTLNLRGFPGSLTRHARDVIAKAPAYDTSFRPYQPISDEQISQVVALQECVNTNTLGQLWTSSMPFLYPFIVQFSLIAAAVTFVMGQNVGKGRLSHKQKFHSIKDLTSHTRMGCDGSSKGLFLGILCMVAGIVVILIFLVVREDDNFPSATLSWLTCGTLIGILTLSGLMTASGLVQVRQMSVVTRAPAALDSLLTNVALFGVQLYSVFTLVVCACSLVTLDQEADENRGRHIMLLAASILQLVQCFAQSTLISEASKRSCITRFQMLAKPGRQVITFLLFSNAVLWAFDTVVTQNWISQELQLRFFGVLAWGILSRISLPLLIFYRFHSCVLLLEAWNKCYRTPRGEHPLN